MNALVMYDNQTDSLWSQFTGEAVEGPLKGISLEFIPSQLITWGAWRDLHPDTLALEKVPYGDFGYESGDDWEQQQQQQVNPTGDPYFAYYHTDARGVIGEANPDDRLYAKEMIVGIAGALTHRAYSYRDLREHPVINDMLEGRAIVVAVDVDSLATGVYDSSPGSRSLTFEQSTEDPLLMIDGETGTVWQKATGLAASGPMKGSQLKRIPFMAAFWFAWTDFNPGTELYRPPSADAP